MATDYVAPLKEISKSFASEETPHWETFYSLLLERLEDMTNTQDADLAMEQLAAQLLK